jgi:hypothetical protein
VHEQTFPTRTSCLNWWDSSVDSHLAISDLISCSRAHLSNRKSMSLLALYEKDNWFDKGKNIFWMKSGPADHLQSVSRPLSLPSGARFTGDNLDRYHFSGRRCTNCGCVADFRRNHSLWDDLCLSERCLRGKTADYAQAITDSESLHERPFPPGVNDAIECPPDSK